MDDTQFILVDGSTRKYYTRLETVFDAIIQKNMKLLNAGDIKSMQDMIALLKRAWGECNKLADAVRADCDAKIAAAKSQPSSLPGN